MNAILNSLIADYFIRFLIDIYVSKTYLMRLPLPQPTESELESRASDERVAAALGLGSADLVQTVKQQDKLAIEIDRLVARLYGITDVVGAALVAAPKKTPIKPTFFRFETRQKESKNH